jgi:hypothetical protein
LKNWLVVFCVPGDLFITLNRSNLFKRSQQSPDNVMNKNSVLYSNNVSICLKIRMIQLTRILDGRPLFSKCIKERFRHMSDHHHFLKGWRCFSRQNGRWVTTGNVNHDLAFLLQGRQIDHGFITKPISISNSIATCKSTLRLNFLKMADRQN